MCCWASVGAVFGGDLGTKGGGAFAVGGAASRDEAPREGIGIVAAYRKQLLAE